MRARLLGLVGVVVVVGFACAQGSSRSLDSGDDDGSGGGGGAGAAGGAGTTSTSSGGGGGSCAESPCKLVVPQCGCPAGEQCTLMGADRVCGPAGTTPVDEVCTMDTCEPGTYCVGTAPPINTCAKFCATDAECEAPGGLCIYTLNDSMGMPIPDVKLCSTNCEPATNVGCPSGTACNLAQETEGQMRILTLCSVAGAGTTGDTCLDNTDCAPNYGCLGDAGGGNLVCLEYCRVGALDCPAGNCIPFSTPVLLGSVEYGTCP